MKLILIVLIAIAVTACATIEPASEEPAGENGLCGGWDMSGKVICECSGEYDTTGCPPGARCDSGAYYCSGECGDCKCYNGNDVEIECQEYDEEI